MQVVGSKGGSESSWLYERQVVPLLNGANIKKSDSALIAALSLADLRQLSAKPFVRQALQQLEPQAAEVGKPNEVRPLAQYRVRPVPTARYSLPWQHRAIWSKSRLSWDVRWGQIFLCQHWIEP